jgi:hypothetical protein
MRLSKNPFSAFMVIMNHTVLYSHPSPRYLRSAASCGLYTILYRRQTAAGNILRANPSH